MHLIYFFIFLEIGQLTLLIYFSLCMDGGRAGGWWEGWGRASLLAALWKLRASFPDLHMVCPSQQNRCDILMVITIHTLCDHLCMN